MTYAIYALNAVFSATSADWIPPSMSVASPTPLATRRTVCCLTHSTPTTCTLLRTATLASWPWRYPTWARTWRGQPTAPSSSLWWTGNSSLQQPLFSLSKVSWNRQLVATDIKYLNFKSIWTSNWSLSAGNGMIIYFHRQTRVLQRAILRGIE